MEDNILDEKTTESGELTLDSDAVKFLKESKGWAMFLAILGFIGAGFMIIAAVIMFGAGSLIGRQLGLPGGILGLVYLIFGVVMVFPPVFLFRFAQKAGTACANNDSAALKESLKNLRSNLKLKGILYIVLIAVYIIIIIAAIGVGLTSAF